MPGPIRLLVTGSRRWPWPWLVHGALLDTWHDASQAWPGRPLVIVHGHCPTGADYYADTWARRNGIPYERHPALWQQYGKRAGPVRNSHMASLGAYLCLAFLMDDSPGASHMIRQARAAKIPTRIIDRTTRSTPHEQSLHPQAGQLPLT